MSSAAAAELAAGAAPGGAAVLGSVGFVSGSIAAYVDSARDKGRGREGTFS